MKKTLLPLLLLLCCQWLKPQYYNEQFPVGHYEQISDEDMACHINFFPNNQACLLLKRWRGDDPDTSFVYMANYKVENDRITLIPFKKSNMFSLFGRHNADLSPGAVKFELDYKPIYLSSAYHLDISVAVGKNIRDNLYESLSDTPENSSEGVFLSANLKAKQGDTLAIRIREYDKIHMFYYSISGSANHFRGDLSLVGGQLIDNPLVLRKGETNNEMRPVSADREDRANSFFYTRPLTNADQGTGEQDSAPEKEGWEYLSASRSWVASDSYEDVAIASVGPAIDDVVRERGKPSADAMHHPYYSSYAEALKAAKKENKFLRIYIAPEGDECAELMKQAYNMYDEANYRQDFDFDNVSQFFEYYVMAILTEKDKKSIQHLGFDYLPVHMVIAPDETLLYAESKACKGYDDSGKLLFEKEEEDFSRFYVQLLMKYNHDVIEPGISDEKKAEKSLGKYLQTICKGADILRNTTCSGSTFSECLNALYESERLYKSEAYYPTAEQIYNYMEMYVQRRMNAPADTALIRMLLQNYYPQIYDYELERTEIPLSMRYLLKNQDKIQWMETISGEEASLSSLYDNYEKLLPSPYSELEESAVFQLYKEGLTLFPDYNAYILFRYFRNSDYFVNYEGDMAKEIIEMYEPYLSELVNQPDINTYLRTSMQNMYRMDPERFSSVFYMGDEPNLDTSIYPEYVAYILSRFTWLVYNSKMDDLYPKAAVWSQKATEIQQKNKAYYLQDYAIFLYRTGSKEKAIQVQKQAYEMQKGKASVSELQLMKTNLLSMIYDTFDSK